jgi:hypothetical protein
MRKYIFDLRKENLTDNELANEYRQPYDEIKYDTDYMKELRQQYTVDFIQTSQDIVMNAQKYNFQIFSIHRGEKEERIKQFKQHIDYIVNECTNENIVLHFIGHGIANKNGSYGIECLSWQKLSTELQKIKYNNKVQINLMSVCCSYGFIRFRKAYDRLWSIDTTTRDYFTPFDIYNNFDFAQFKTKIDKNSKIKYNEDFSN